MPFTKLCFEFLKEGDEFKIKNDFFDYLKLDIEKTLNILRKNMLLKYSPIYGGYSIQVQNPNYWFWYIDRFSVEDKMINPDNYFVEPQERPKLIKPQIIEPVYDDSYVSFEKMDCGIEKMYLAGYKLKEISERFNLPISTIYNIIKDVPSNKIVFDYMKKHFVYSEHDFNKYMRKAKSKKSIVKLKDVNGKVHAFSSRQFLNIKPRVEGEPKENAH